MPGNVRSLHDLQISSLALSETRSQVVISERHVTLMLAVIPAKAGIQGFLMKWIPAFAGMTGDDGG